MADLGMKLTGQSGVGPLLTGGLGVVTLYFESLASAFTGVGLAQANAAYTSNYVDSVCKGD